MKTILDPIQESEGFLIIRDPSMSGSFASRTFKPLTRGGIRQSVFTLISAAMGGGILCLPYAMHLSGLVIGLGLLIIAGSLGFLSMRMLMMCAARTNTFSYGELFAVATGSPYACMTLDVITVLFSQGVVVAYFVYLSDFIPSVADSLGLSFLTSRTQCVVFCLVAAIPFAIPQKLSALQNITPVTTFALLVTSIVVVYRTFVEYTGDQSAERVSLITAPSLSIFQSFALTVSVFICHTNVVTVSEELVNPSDKRSTKITIRVAITLFLIYLCLSICGYITFGDAVQQNFITNYSPKDPLINICRVLLSSAIFFGIPLNTHPAVRSLIGLWNGWKTSSRNIRSQPLLGTNAEIVIGYSVGMSRIIRSTEYHDFRIIRVSIGIVIMIVGAVTSLFVPGIASVVSVLGGSLGTLITLFFPAIIYSSVFQVHNLGDKLQVASLITGSIICFTSVVLTVLGIA